MACDAVDAMAVRLKKSLTEQQREQQRKQELIAGMSHDLKSPLTTIRAYTEALLEGVAPDEPTRQRYLQTIYARETDLEALVNRLFELAKLGASEYPMHLKALPLQETLHHILNACDHEGISVDCDAVIDCTVLADRELLQRVLNNLVDNSRKYGANARLLALCVRRIPLPSGWRIMAPVCRKNSFRAFLNRFIVEMLRAQNPVQAAD